MTALTLIIPIFGLVLVGWLASLTKIISERVGDGLSEYVFSLAVPALIVSTLTRPGLSGEIAWGYWASYFGGAALAWTVGSLIGRRTEGVDRRGAVLHGFAASQSNTVFVGVPMILQAYGEAGAFPLFMLLAVHLPLMMGAATLLIESEGGRSYSQRLKALGLALGKNLIFLALVVGMAMKAAGLSFSGIPKALVDSPMFLFSLWTCFTTSTM